MPPETAVSGADEVVRRFLDIGFLDDLALALGRATAEHDPDAIGDVVASLLKGAGYEQNVIDLVAEVVSGNMGVEVVVASAPPGAPSAWARLLQGGDL